MKRLYHGLILMSLFAVSNFIIAKKVAADAQETTPPVVKNYQVELEVHPLAKTEISSEDQEALKTLLNEHLSIISKSAQPNLDQEQESILVLEVPEEIKQILATEGFFNNQVKVTPKTISAQRGYSIDVGIGQPVLIKEKLVTLTGPIEKDPQLSEIYEKIAQAWLLNPNDIFKQKLWTNSKNIALELVQEKKYPLAEITDSYAQINPNDNSVLLSLEINSGEIIYFGDIEVRGAKKYPESIVKNMATFHTGDTFDGDKLDDFQNKLEADGHYTQVVVVPGYSKIVDQRVPIYVAVQEQLKKSFAAELTFDSEDGPGIFLEYQYYNLFKRGYIGTISANYNKYEEQLSLAITQPQHDNGRYLNTKTDYYKGSRNGLDTRLWSTGFWYGYSGKHSETRLGLEYYQEDLRQKNGERISKNDLLLTTLEWKINKIQTLLRPERGYYLSAKVGTTLGKLASDAVAQRYEIDGDYYLTPWPVNYGTFLFRGQVGYIETSDPDKIPDELKFKLGGSGSVRGYPIDSIGIDKGSYVLGGLAKVAATVEYQKPVYKNISIAVFHDVGDVKNKFKGMKMKQSTGLGVRWYSVAAPLAFDVAYAHDRKKFGWNLSLGTRF